MTEGEHGASIGSVKGAGLEIFCQCGCVRMALSTEPACRMRNKCAALLPGDINHVPPRRERVEKYWESMEQIGNESMFQNKRSGNLCGDDVLTQRILISALHQHCEPTEDTLHQSTDLSAMVH